MNIAALVAELMAGHPDTGVYSGTAATAAGQLNAVNRTTVKSSMSGDEIFAATNAIEFVTITDHKRGMWLSFCARDSIDPAGASNVALVNWIFGDSSATLTALAAARTNDVSRAQELGLGKVGVGHVQIARAQ